MTALLSYNEVVWTSLYKTHVSWRPVFDEAHRALACVEYTLETDGFVTGGTNATMQDMRRLLSAPAGELKYNDHGMGETFHINGDSVVKDAKFGPHTDVVEFTPLGGNGQSARVKWRVVFNIPECVGGRTRYQFGLMALNYELSFSKDADGYETVRTTGYLEVPMTRRSVTDRRPPDSADRYRERLEGREAPLGYRRQDQTYTLSKDRRRLDFTWSDVQQPSPLPNKVTKIDVRQLHRSEGMVNNTLWHVTWRGAVTVGAGVDKSEALAAFLQTVASRTSRETQGRSLFTRLEVDEEIFGRTSHFLLHARYMRPGRIEDVLKAYGCWQPIAGASWEAWRESMTAAGVFKSRGTAQLAYLPSEDAIVDLCEPAKPLVAAPGEVNRLRRNSRFVKFPKPPKRKPGETWIDFQAWFRWREWMNVVRHKPLPPSPVRPPGKPQPGRGGSLRPFDTPGPSGGPSGSLRPFDAGAGGGGSLRPFPESRPQAVAPITTGADTASDTVAAPGPVAGPSSVFPADIIQQAASPTRTAQLMGYGMRVGKKVAAPKLLTVGGVSVVLSDSDIVSGIIGVIDGEEIHMTSWVLTYLVPDAPSGELPVCANPMWDSDGGGE